MMARETKPDEESPAAEAFAVIANRLATDVANERGELRAECDRLMPLRDYLASLEIHVDGRVVASAGLDAAVIVKREGDDPSAGNNHHLCLRIPDITSPVPLARFMVSAGSTLTVSKQTVGVFPGCFPPIIKINPDGTNCFVLAASENHLVEGKLHNLTGDDVANILDDKGLFVRYMMTGEGLSPGITFTPKLIYLELTPGLHKVVDLLGPLRKSVNGRPTQDADTEDPKNPFEELSPTDEMLRCVFSEYGNSDHIDLMKDYLFLKEEINTLSKICALIGSVEICSDADEKPMDVTLDKGVLVHDLHDDGNRFWDICLSGRNYSVPINGLHSLQVILSGAAGKREQVRMFTAHSLICLEIWFLNGVNVRGFLEGSGLNELTENLDERMEDVMGHILNGEDAPPLDLILKLFSLRFVFSSVEDRLRMLGINADPDSSENNIDDVE